MKRLSAVVVGVILLLSAAASAQASNPNGKGGDMPAYYDAQLQRYGQDKQAAADLVKAGVTPVDTRIDTVQLAALMNLTTVIMNTPDAYSIR